MTYYLIRLCMWFDMLFFFFKQKTAYEMRISDWSSDVCSSDLTPGSDPSPPSDVQQTLRHSHLCAASPDREGVHRHHRRARSVRWHRRPHRRFARRAVAGTASPLPIPAQLPGSAIRQATRRRRPDRGTLTSEARLEGKGYGS